MIWHKWWGVKQWAAYLEHMNLPVRASSKRALTELEAMRGELLAPKDLSLLMIDDALFALRLLKEANQRLPRHLARDITTPIGAVLTLGTALYSKLLQDAPEVDESNHGFFKCEARAALSARIAFTFGSYHHDLDPGELALAALLSNAGEIELWAFAPDLPQSVLDELKTGRARRSEQAQLQVCGFVFKDVTLELCERWHLPTLITQLIRGDGNLRAKLARLAGDMARHLVNGTSDPALPFDISEAAHLTGASLATVAHSLPLLNDEEKAVLQVAAEAYREANPGLPSSKNDLAHGGGQGSMQRISGGKPESPRFH